MEAQTVQTSASINNYIIFKSHYWKLKLINCSSVICNLFTLNPTIGSSNKKSFDEWELALMNFKSHYWKLKQMLKTGKCKLPVTLNPTIGSSNHRNRMDNANCFIFKSHYWKLKRRFFYFRKWLLCTLNPTIGSSNLAWTCRPCYVSNL